MKPKQQTEPWSETNLNAMFIASCRAHGAAAAVREAGEDLRFEDLMRRTAALSCFIDERALKGCGPVVIFLPPGHLALCAFFACLWTGRSAFIVDAVSSRRLAEGTIEGIRPTDGALPRAESFAEAPGLILSIRALDRILQAGSPDRVYASTPVLYADEIADAMDAGHQETIRERLGEAWLGRCSQIAPETPALIEVSRAKPDAPTGGKPILYTHGDLANAVRARIATLEEPRPSRFLAMTSMGSPRTWTDAYLPSIALGARLSFVQLFYPAHVATEIQEEGIEALMMTSKQYEELLPVVQGRSWSAHPQYWSPKTADEELASRWLAATGKALESSEARS